MNVHPSYYPLLLMLYPKEQRNPEILWSEFRSSFKIEEVRESLAQILETCLCTDCPNFQEPAERSNISIFISLLMALLEAKYRDEERTTISEIQG